MPKYVTVTKKWQEVPGEKGPDQIEMEVYAKDKPDEVLATAVLNTDNHWSELIRETNDKKLFQPGVDLSVREKESEYKADYEATVESKDNGKQLILTNKRKVVTRSVKKHWNDQKNAYQTRPEKVSVQLYRRLETELETEEKAYRAPVELTAADNWEYVFKDLPKSVKGVNYEYSVKEVNAPVGYRAEYSDVLTEVEGNFTTTGLDITNNFYPATTDLEFTKELRWNSQNGRLQPLQGGEFEFLLMDENSKIVAISKNTGGDAGNPAQITFSGIEFYKPGEYHYTVQEVAPNLEGTDSRENIEIPVINYDKAVKKVTITVKSVEGELKVTDVHYDNQKFVNVVKTSPRIISDALPELHIKPLAVVLDFGKELKNLNTHQVVELEKNAFTFQLLNKNGTVISTAGNEKSQIEERDGKHFIKPASIHFAPLFFTEPGVYEYTAKEIVPIFKDSDDLLLEYDNRIRRVTVTVTLSDNGELQASVDYSMDTVVGDTSLSQVFVNTIKILPTQAEQLTESPALPPVPPKPSKPTTTGDTNKKPKKELPVTPPLPSTEQNVPVQVTEKDIQDRKERSNRELPNTGSSKAAINITVVGILLLGSSILLFKKKDRYRS